MNPLELVLTWGIILVLVYALFATFFLFRLVSKKNEDILHLRRRVQTLYQQRDLLARGWLLAVIPQSKITKVEKRPSVGLMFSINSGLHGLVASGLDTQERAVLDEVDALLDGGIRTDGKGNQSRFQIP